jgi:hypothetical protein
MLRKHEDRQWAKVRSRAYRQIRHITDMIFTYTPVAIHALSRPFEGAMSAKAYNAYEREQKEFIKRELHSALQNASTHQMDSFIDLIDSSKDPIARIIDTYGRFLSGSLFDDLSEITEAIDSYRVNQRQPASPNTDDMMSRWFIERIVDAAVRINKEMGA